MYGLTYEQIVEKIKTENGISQEDIEKKVKAKLKQLSDLISKEGAAHIVANELGVKLFQPQKKRLKIRELVPMARNVELAAKVLKLYEIRGYNVKGREGRVASILVGDETGVVRVVLWDENFIRKIENGELKEEDIIKVNNGYVKENNGYKELHLGSGASLDINPEGEKVEVNNPNASHREIQKKSIKDLKENDQALIYGTVVQVFEPKTYEACPDCGKKLELQGAKFACKTHGIVEPIHATIVNIFFDDGTDNIRVVCFREQAEKILGINTKEIVQIKNDSEKFQQIKNKVLLQQLRITGRVTKNQMFGRLEFVAQNVEQAKPEEIIEELAQ